MTRQSVRRTANVLVGALVAMSVVSILGCASTHTGPVGSDRLLRERYFVGGCLMINWVAQQDGTAYVVMSPQTGRSRIVQTQYLKKGGEFEFSIAVDEQEAVDQIEKALGVKLSEATFSLYFVPSTETDPGQ